MTQSTIPKGISFNQWARDVGQTLGRELDPQKLAETLGLHLSKEDLGRAFTEDRNIDLSRAFSQDEISAFAQLQQRRDRASPMSVFSLFGDQKQEGGPGRIIRGPLSGYTVTDAARQKVRAGEVTEQDVIDASTAAGNAVSDQVETAVKEALQDGHLTMTELQGGEFARALRFIGLKVGPSISSAMEDDTALQFGKIDPNDYRVFVDLLRRADQTEGQAGRITLGEGVRAKLEASVRDFQEKMIEGPQTSAFIEKVGDEYLVNQTAMTWADLGTEKFLENLPPQFWAEDCFDLRSIHSEVLSRDEREDGGYKMVMLQRMEFGDAPTATDMTKLTVVEKWQDESGEWRATARWKVFASDPTDQIDHAGSMRIDQGRMEFRPVEKDGKKYTEIIFNNQTQTNTELEKKIFDWMLSKENPVRAEISSQLAAGEFKGIQDFSGAVTDRYRSVGTGQVESRWPNLSESHVSR